MKALMLIGEWLLGLLLMLISVVTILLGLLISVIEIPRYLKIKSM